MNKKTFGFTEDFTNKLDEASYLNTEQILIDLKMFNLSNEEMLSCREKIVKHINDSNDMFFVYELGDSVFDIRNQKYHSSNGMYKPPPSGIEGAVSLCYHCRTGKIPDKTYSVFCKALEPIHKKIMEETKKEVKALVETRHKLSVESVMSEILQAIYTAYYEWDLESWRCDLKAYSNNEERTKLLESSLKEYYSHYDIFNMECQGDYVWNFKFIKKD